MKVHFLQSPAWQKFHETLGHETVSDRGEGWHYMAIIEKNHGIKRLYCPYGPTANNELALKQALESLTSKAKKHGAVYLRVQPLGFEFSGNITTSLNLKPVPYSQPSHTWTINLQSTPDELLADMKQNTRNIVRNYSKKGLVYRTSTDPKEIDHLLKLLSGVAKHNQITVHSDEYLSKQASALLSVGAAELHFIEYQSQIIAAALTYIDDDTVYYAHAAADYEHRKLNASTALVGEILLNAKQRGKTYFDLFGVTVSDDPKHRWAGFTKFKQSFGGKLQPLSQTYETPVNPLLYRVYIFARKISRR